jgi:hypothetical protein
MMKKLISLKKNMPYNKSLNKKGFIGAIGDDLPSLIPILISLLLFFTIFSLTLNTYNSKNVILRKNMGLMSISRELKGDSLILDVNQFKLRCDNTRLTTHAYNFRVGIYSNEKLTQLATNGEQIIDNFKNIDEGIENFIDGQYGTQREKYYCEYKRPGARDLTSGKISYITRFYPVAVQLDEQINGEDYLLIEPAVMVMVIWE